MLGLPQGGTEDQMGRSIVRQYLYPCFLSHLIFWMVLFGIIAQAARRKICKMYKVALDFSIFLLDLLDIKL